ncbi:MAG: discoidin domain-containing protein [Clostridia bacterium]|nr:discoidin domain-containing protein [Clostridia bacterium]
MKKALSLMLTMCLVLSLFATFVISASAEEATNLAAGKSYTYPTDGLYVHWDAKWECSKNVATAITDGVKDAGYYGEGATSGWGGGSPNPLEVVIDLEAVYSLESFTYTVCGGVDGISEPESVSILVSEDGENFTAVEVTTTAGEKVSPLDWTDCYDRESVAVAASAVNGRYVKFSFAKNGNFVFINELEVFGKEVPAGDKVVTWKDGQIKDPADSTGRNWKFDNAYGYTFVIDADKKIGGEDNVLIETVDEYNACNPNWAISVLLKPAGDLYEVVTVVVTPGSAAAGIEKGIAIENGNIVLVAHSSASYSAEDADPAKDFDADGNYKYFNWQTKLAAIALKAGDKVKVADDKSSVYVLIPGVDDKETVLVKGDNIVAGKDYVISEQFRQGGQDVNWGYDPDAPIAYPDEGGTLTDGVLDTDVTENVYADAIWAGFSANAPTYADYGYNFVNFDLGEAKDIYEMAIYLGTSALTAGIGVSNSTVQFFASDDGETWEAVSEEIVPEDDASVHYVKVAAKVNTNARYLQVRFARSGWLFVSEVEVYEAVPASEDVVLETITVDGDLSDNGWAADKWTSVNADNGYWQSVPESETISYKYQLRADDTKLYAAFVIDCAAVEGGNGVGTNVRFWINTDSEATVYTHFYDVYLKDGAVAVNAKYNTAKDANSGANIENSTINAVMTTKDGKTYVEFSVDLAEFNGAEGFNYFACVSNKVNENVCLYYPVVAEGESRTSNLPYAKWYAEGQATVDVEAIKLGVVSGDTDDNLGDAGIYAIASLALVALIGTAVVIKKRA